jgi:hypothetical protein
MVKYTANSANPILNQLDEPEYMSADVICRKCLEWFTLINAVPNTISMYASASKRRLPG